MNVGDPDGYGEFGVLDEDAGGLLCHECGRRFSHLGLHAWKGHGMTADGYRRAHGLSRNRGLVASATRALMADNARKKYPAKSGFIAACDPAAATLARLSGGPGMSPQGLAASRSRPGRGRKGTVVICAGCGAQFCPLSAARKRLFCSRSCASRVNRRRRTPR